MFQSHQWSLNGGEWKSNIKGCHAQGDFKKNIYESLSLTLFPQVTETRALIEKHYYRIDVIQKLLAKKATEEEER